MGRMSVWVFVEGNPQYYLNLYNLFIYKQAVKVCLRTWTWNRVAWGNSIEIFWPWLRNTLTLWCELPPVQNAASVGIWLLVFISGLCCSAQESHHFLSGLQMDQAVMQISTLGPSLRSYIYHPTLQRVRKEKAMLAVWFPSRPLMATSVVISGKTRCSLPVLFTLILQSSLWKHRGATDRKQD